MYRVKGTWGYVEILMRAYTKWTNDASKALTWKSATEAAIAICEFDIADGEWEICG